MALYHFSVKQVKRSEGHTAIAAAAYISGEKLYDHYYGEVQDYTKKEGVVLTEIILPDHVPKRLSDRETLWNEVENLLPEHLQSSLTMKRQRKLRSRQHRNRQCRRRSFRLSNRHMQVRTDTGSEYPWKNC